ncbi:uncharacterized protein LOC141637602 [Silene latifolia]|uniref:uncharacterized protein LOC141637602 n=1 Tax=Silene latifolia TaxID=37657 RepID=UPI003D77DE4A
MAENLASGSGIPQSTDAKSTKSIGEIVGIPPLELDSIVEHDIQFEHEEEDNREVAQVTDEIGDAEESGWTQVSGRKRSKSPVSSPSSSSSKLIQLSMEDVQPELDYCPVSPMPPAVISPVSPNHPFGGPTHHNSSVLIPEFNDEADISSLWNKLKQLRLQINGPWRVCGDFNTILDYNERLGRPVLWSEVAEFRQCVDNCDITDLQAQGSFFTWNNKHEPSSRVFSRIDRCLVCLITLQSFVIGGRVVKLGKLHLDISICGVWILILKKLSEGNGLSMCQAFLCIKSPQNSGIRKKLLRHLNKNRYADIDKATAVARQQLNDIQTKLCNQPRDLALRQEEREAATVFYDLQKAHYSFLQQKAKTAWLKEGDENTAFYHRRIKARQVNATNITLIPKIPNPASVMDFRPIACCNTVYKCIAKILCARLGQVLPNIISRNQGGFIQGGNIVENVLICQDIVRLYKRKAASSRCLIKIDLRKAYDTVEWDFLSQMLAALKFPKHFIDLVMMCVTSTSYSLSLNGNSFGFFKGSRGLRQGDPLSPLLFTIYMEYLSRILKVVGQQQDFKFHPMCGPLQLNQLLFVDDLLLFSKGDEISIMWLLRALSTFSVASGLCLNRDKSEIYFNGMASGAIESILQVSGFKKGSLPFRYLGVPISSKKLTKNQGMKLIDKITTRIRSWGARHLSYSGRLVLVNYVLSGLHSHWSSIFLIPNGILNKIDAICRKYLCGGNENYMKAPNIKWDTCCTLKEEGGLGIKASKLWNKALLGKCVWWIASKKNHLWVNQVYMKGNDWTSYEPPSDCSWSWKKIANLFKLFAPAYTSGKWLVEDKEYRVQDGYNWLRNIKPKVIWRFTCWNQLNVPKTSFIYWAAIQGRLLTKDRLVTMGTGVDTLCFLCGIADETHQHLFNTCPYSIQCITLVQQTLNTKAPADALSMWFNNRHGGTKLQKSLVCAVYVAVTYAIWRVRNKARISAYVPHPVVLVRNTVKEVIIRFWARNKGKAVIQQLIRSDDVLWR